MPDLRSAFHQLLEPLDRRIIARAVAAHAGDRGVGSGERAWTGGRRLRGVLFAQWAGLTSLREIVAGLGAQRRRFCHLNRYHLNRCHLNRRAPCQCSGRMGPGLRRGDEWMSRERFLHRLFRRNDGQMFDLLEFFLGPALRPLVV